MEYPLYGQKIEAKVFNQSVKEYLDSLNEKRSWAKYNKNKNNWSEFIKTLLPLQKFFKNYPYPVTHIEVSTKHSKDDNEGIDAKLWIENRPNPYKIQITLAEQEDGDYFYQKSLQNKILADPQYRHISSLSKIFREKPNGKEYKTYTLKSGEKFYAVEWYNNEYQIVELIISQIKDSIIRKNKPKINYNILLIGIFREFIYNALERLHSEIEAIKNDCDSNIDIYIVDLNGDYFKKL